MPRKLISGPGTLVWVQSRCLSVVLQDGVDPGDGDLLTRGQTRVRYCQRLLSQFLKKTTLLSIPNAPLIVESQSVRTGSGLQPQTSNAFLGCNFSSRPTHTFSPWQKKKKKAKRHGGGMQMCIDTFGRSTLSDPGQVQTRSCYETHRLCSAS